MQAVRFGERIKAARDRLGWNQSDLARRSGVSRVQIGRYERGEKPAPTETTMRKLEAALGLLVDADEPSSVDSCVTQRTPDIRDVSRYRALPAGPTWGETTEGYPVPAADLYNRPDDHVMANVSDESMTPELQPGDLVLVDITAVKPRSRELVVAHINGHTVIRRWLVEDHVSYLVAVNPYWPREPADGCVVMGTITALWRRTYRVRQP